MQCTECIQCTVCIQSAVGMQCILCKQCMHVCRQFTVGVLCAGSSL